MGESPLAFLRSRPARWGLLAVGVIVVLYLERTMPKDRRVRLTLGSQRARVSEVELAYTLAGDTEEVRHIVHRYPTHDAPLAVTDTAKLAPGLYVVDITVSAGEKRHSEQRKVTITSDDHASIDLTDLIP